MNFCSKLISTFVNFLCYNLGYSGLLLVPAPISEKFPGTKKMTDFCLSQHFELCAKRGNRYTSLSLKNSSFLLVGDWRFRIFKSLFQILENKRELSKNESKFIEKTTYYCIIHHKTHACFIRTYFKKLIWNGYPSLSWIEIEKNHFWG